MKAFTGAMSRKVDNWPAHLARIVDEYKTHDFEWGKSDCGTFACDIIYSLTGIDLYKEFVSRYDSEFSYMRLLAKYKCSGIVDLFSNIAGKHGIFQVDLKSAQRGDIVALSQSAVGVAEQECLGVCVGPYAMFHTQYGLYSVPILECSHAWKID